MFSKLVLKMKEKDFGIKIFLLLNICISLFFVFYKIGERSLWLDEAATANMMRYSFIQLFSFAVTDNHPLFYIYALKIWSLIFSDSEIALRSFSAIFVILFVTVIYKITKDIFQNKKIGIIATVLASTNYFLIWYGQQVRPYTLIPFLSLLSFCFYWRLMRFGKKRDILVYILTMVVGIYTHFFFVFILGAHVLTLLIFRKYFVSFFKTGISLLTIFIFALPNLYLMWKLSELGINSWIPRVGFLALLESFSYFTYGSTLLYLVFTFCAFFFIYIFKLKFLNFLEKSSFAMLVTILFFPLFTALIVSQFQPMYVIGRYEIIVLPYFIMAMSYLFSKLHLNLILFGIIPIVFLLLTIRNVNLEKQVVASFQADDRKIVSDILTEINTNETVITTDLSFATMNYYFLHLKNGQNFTLISFPQEIEDHPGWKNFEKMLQNKNSYEAEARDLVTSLKSKEKEQRIFVIYKQGNKINEILYNELKNNFELVETREIPQPSQPMWFDEILIFR